ncbi:phytanoyl-CoA dioxygenase domain-containing protein 1 homolog [Sitodiplosis mosellana]|uniref:phytanoyl-CoA dioxygenase domain-containing protein 1 homolog n=1 Tax=Sitodiplosis mosellana TaxID=263140 RepID=UPI002443E3A9|nr:phytanoyl-CoA dioxygenase domain-containing protein 1 homolog [Sitodiplosis mosellana]
MSKWPLDQYDVNGFAVIEDFLTEEEANELHEAGLELCKNAPENDRAVFNTENKSSHLKDKYFLNSANKIHYFYENGALDDQGNLLVNKSVSLNKVGHALHALNPTFKKYTFDERVKNIAKQLGFKKPTIPQSMFIYKNPKIGGEVKPHQDATYLHTEPISITGFWIPTEDATLENGCLWFIKGSHKHGLDNRLIRNPVRNSDEFLVYDKPSPAYSQDLFVAAPVKKGSLVVIHGLVVHQSELNRSEKSRFAYTFHVMETDNVKYSPENWLQLPKGEHFPELY